MTRRTLLPLLIARRFARCRLARSRRASIRSPPRRPISCWRTTTTCRSGRSAASKAAPMPRAWEIRRRPGSILLGCRARPPRRSAAAPASTSARRSHRKRSPNNGGSVQQLPNFVGFTINVRGGLTAGFAVLTTNSWSQETDAELITSRPPARNESPIRPTLNTPAVSPLSASAITAVARGASVAVSRSP